MTAHHALAAARSSAAPRCAALERRSRLLTATVLACTALAGVVALVAGHQASSISLVGFGLACGVEILAAGAAAWRLGDPAERERPAARLVASASFGVAAVVSADALRTLLGSPDAQPSRAGLALAAVSLLGLSAAGLAQRRAGIELRSRRVVAGSTRTLRLGALSSALLLGVGSTAILGWAWADALAALVVAGWALHEGLAARRGDASLAHVPWSLRRVGTAAAPRRPVSAPPVSRV